MDGLLDWAREAMTTGGSFALGLVMLAENLFPPIPSEVVLPYAGFLVGRGDLSFAQALVASTAGSVLGALILYAVGRYGGRPLVLRLRPLLRIKEHELDRADGWFDRHGDKVVFFARMIPLARSVVSVPAGWSEMPVGRFLLLTTAGSALWNALLVGAGVLLGENYEQVGEVVGTFSTVVLVTVVLAFAALAWWWWRRVRDRRTVGSR